MADCIGHVMVLLKSLPFMYIEYTDSARLYNLFGDLYARRLFDTLADHLIPGATPSRRDTRHRRSTSPVRLANPLSPNDRAAYADVQKAVAMFEYQAENVGFFKPPAKYSQTGAAAAAAAAKLDTGHKNREDMDNEVCRCGGGAGPGCCRAGFEGGFVGGFVGGFISGFVGVFVGGFVEDL